MAKPLLPTIFRATRIFTTPSTEGEGLLACASVPLRIGGQIIGTLDVHSKCNPNAFDANDIHILEMLASQAAIAIEKRQAI